MEEEGTCDTSEVFASRVASALTLTHLNFTVGEMLGRGELVMNEQKRM